MLTLAEIALRAHATACEKGWHDRPMRTYRVNVDSHEYYEINHDAVLRSHALIHTELTEALDDMDSSRLTTLVRADGKPEGLTTELADVVIRVCDTVQALGLSFSPDSDLSQWEVSPASQLANPKTEHMRMLLAEARRNVDRATEAARVDNWHAYIQHLRNVVSFVLTVAVAYGLSLPAAIEAKMTYNATRPTRHGGKRA